MSRILLFIRILHLFDSVKQKFTKAYSTIAPMLNQRIVETKLYSHTTSLVFGKILAVIDLKLTDMRIETVQSVTLAIEDYLLIQKLR
jgi:hypothetical protein